MSKVALAEESFQIAVAHGADMLAAQRRPLVPVSLGVGLVAGTGSDRGREWRRPKPYRAGRPWIGPGVLSEGEMIPKGTG
jgi:hypothetical protein